MKKNSTQKKARLISKALSLCIASSCLVSVAYAGEQVDERTQINRSQPTATDEKTDSTAIALPDLEITDTGSTSIAVSGSSTVLNKETLFRDHVANVNEALRKAPGVYVRDEEGMGIRPNIGIRGMNPFRSTKILFMEDGLPFNFAPYGDNDIYYHPPVERYDGIEIFKGADLTQFGPQTISGAINYLTPKIPTKPGGFASFTGGNRDYLNGHLRYGGMAKNVKGVDGVGGLIDFIHKEGSGARDNTFAQLDDVNLKGVININAQNTLTVRGDYYREDSQSTFGITQKEYENFGQFYNPFKNDHYTTERFGTSATHEFRFNDDVTLSTSFYWSKFSRDWWRQMNQQPTDPSQRPDGSFSAGEQCGTAFRDARLAGQRVDVDTCNFTRGRLRDYETWGFTQNLHAKHQLFGIDSEFDAGYRAHFETQNRLTVDGNSPTARTGNTIENNDRFADAYSGFAQNRFLWGDWTVTPGVRVESVSYQRRNNLPGGKQGQSSLTEVLPSFAMTYTPIDEAILFFDMHRGFAPPRVEDSVYANGQSVEIGAEKSWNYELGVRSQPMAGMKTELTYFRNDFDALTVLGTVGGNDTPVAQGSALFEGIEFMNRIDAGEMFNWEHNPYLQIAYTWLPTAQSTSPFQCMPLSDGTMSPACPGGNVAGSESGKRLPYTPEHLLTATLGYSHPNGFDAHFETVFVADQFADFRSLNSGADHPNGANSPAALSGQYGKINDYVVVNFSASYKVQKDLTLYVSLKNMLDNTYVVDRVRGILPGSPRLVQAGFKYDF
ncbi:TonB-dependent receptor family protein [Crenothrix polyspora]|uniref:TonB-dependent receptor n=1 Tax=Crenothrix polyspora TaxID=360316 RepID=A0A1R4H984_9GAMM|nr:TonB-dependent receptor [Crenothrix polyspora]SJM92783.1 TonB-dependent receptor [Crenothrix polyspora]